jgi:outer membrane immunogenic protein
LSSSDWETGYTVGGGIEWAFSPNWSLKSEYLYVDLGDQTFSSPAGTYTTETDFHTARVGLNYRF